MPLRPSVPFSFRIAIEVSLFNIGETIQPTFQDFNQHKFLS